MCSRIIENLVKGLEIDSNCSYGSQHFSGIYRNGKNLFKGSNNLRNSYNGKCTCYSTHAEMDVIYKLLKKIKDPCDLSNYCIAVVRIGRDGFIKNSRPCNECLETMIKYRIKKIIYSNEHGDFKVEKPWEMEKQHTSSGFKFYMKTFNF